MGRYTMIADTGRYLVRMLQGALVPDLVPDPSKIGLRSPEDREDLAVGIYLYDVRQSEAVCMPVEVVSRDRILRPPVFLDLSYMITPYAKGDVQYRLVQEEQLLGRIIQFFHEHPVIPLGEVDPQQTSGTDLHIRLLHPDLDERSKIWSFPDIASRLSLYYQVSPVAIDAGAGRPFTRVTDVEVNVSAGGGRWEQSG